MPTAPCSRALAYLLWEAEPWHMCAFALVPYEPDFFVEFFNQCQLVAGIQLLWEAGKGRRGCQSSKHSPIKTTPKQHSRGKGVGGSIKESGRERRDAEAS